MKSFITTTAVASLLLLGLCRHQHSVVEAARPQRLEQHFLEDGTPIWRYVDLPPLEQVFGTEASNDTADEQDDPDAYDASHRRMKRDIVRQLQNGCPGNDGAYSYEFNQEIIITLYDAPRAMRPNEIIDFERIVRDVWNDPRNNCFPGCFIVDKITVIEQDYDDGFDHDHDNGQRALAGSDDEQVGDDKADDFSRTLKEALSDEDEEDDEEYNYGGERRLHRKRRNRVKADANGRCRSACREPIKAGDRRRLEMLEDERTFNVEVDGEVAEYYAAIEAEDSQHPHRRLFGCEEILTRELDEAALAYRGIGQSAFYCITIDVRSESDKDPECHTHKSYSQSWSGSLPSASRSYGKGKGKGGVYYKRERGKGDGKGKGTVVYNTNHYTTNYYRYSKGSKGSKGSRRE